MCKVDDPVYRADKGSSIHHLLGASPAQLSAKIMAAPYTIHSSTLFDPKAKAFVSNISITIEPISGLIVDVTQRPTPDSLGETVPDGDIDLRGKVVLPGFVDAHTHVYLHSYE